MPRESKKDASSDCVCHKFVPLQNYRCDTQLQLKTAIDPDSFADTEIDRHTSMENPSKLSTSSKTVSSRQLLQQNRTTYEFASGRCILLQTYIENSPVVLYSIDSNGMFTLSEGKGLKALGLETGEVVGKSILEIFSDYPDILANIKRALAGEETRWVGEFNNCIYENRTIPLCEVTGEVIGLVGMAIDVTQKTKAEEQLRLLAAAVEHAEDSILITSTEMTFPGPEIVFVNRAFTKMTGYTAHEVLGQSPRILQGPKTDRAVLDRLRENLKEEKIFYGEAINYRKDGTEFYNEWHIEPIRNSTNQITHYLAIQRDITQRKQMEAKLRHEALHDSLTSLPNRTSFVNKVRQCIEQSAESSSTLQSSQDALFAVLVLDLDRFKVINDSLGYKAGDKMLVAIANRLKASVRPDDMVARIGGDEFAILLENINDIANVSSIADRLQSILREPLHLEGQEVMVTASIGIALS
ncbi:MAG: diguanylate cyclase, partial [Tolypothrix sp. T3-bin4]|nr:diguanylate cyclase [Tolypothrix sp. T3-bin4]